MLLSLVCAYSSSVALINDVKIPNVCIYHAFLQNAQTFVLMQLQSGPPLDEMSMACILRDLLHAIEYLHNEGKIHRDIKGVLPSSSA